MSQQPFTGSLKPGAKLGKYEVREQLGAGGMAVIYKAYDPTLDRYVAIKQIAPHLAQDERFLERFRTEAQTLAKLSASQANIVTVHELIQQDGQLYLVMECVVGTTLRTLMDRGPVPLQTGLGILLSTALGLKAMHTQGIVHRDLTPVNIMMAKDGALKITDFGLIGHSGGKTSLPMGTTKYMAPEMFTGMPVDPRADLYSLGMIAYEMFVGPDKFAEVFKDVLRDEKAQQVRWMHWHSNPTLKAAALKDLQPGIPPLVVKIVERMMEKDPSKRFASAEQIIKWLRRIFVMHVQGKSVSVSDSESIEKEMEAEVSGTTAPAVRPGAAPAAGAAGAPAAVPDGDKTAPLPVPKWTWKRAAFWAAIVLTPLILAAAGILVWKHYQLQDRITLAQADQAVGDAQYNGNQWAAAETTFAKMVQDFRDLRDYRLYAMLHGTMARAKMALEKKNWPAADQAIGDAEQNFGADPQWVKGIRADFQKAQDIDGQFKAAELAEKNKEYERARDILINLQNTYPGTEGLADEIARLREKIELREYQAKIAQVREQIEKEKWDQALVFLDEARKIRETPEVVELVQKVKVEKAVAQLVLKVQQLEKDGKWADAVGVYADIMKLKPSEKLRQAMINAQVQDLEGQLDLLIKNNLQKEALDICTKVLALDPKNLKANEYMKRVNGQQQLDSYIAAAKNAMAAGKWNEAINSANQAIGLLPPGDTAIKPEMEGIIKEASYQKPWNLAQDAFKRGDLAGAKSYAAEAQAVKDTDEVKAFLVKVDKWEQYKRYLENGKELLSQGNYALAIAAFEKAIKVMSTPEARELLAEANYRLHFTAGKSLLNDKKPVPALARFNIARRYKETPELLAYIDMAIKSLPREQKE